VAFVFLYIWFLQGDKQPAFLVKAGALGIFHFGTMTLPSSYFVVAGIGLCSLYGALALAYILYSFRKTVSAEIYFFAFWVLSVGLEVLRLWIFDLAAGDGSVYWQIVTTKALLFARYTGYFSLFTSGLYAAGFRSEKLGTAIMVVLALSFGLAASMPVDTGSFARTFELQAGYIEINAGLAILVTVLTVADYLYASHSTGERSYLIIALGAATFLVGHRLLTTQWNPAAIVMGFVLLVVGSWLYVSHLHTYYLWQ
jgi:hypothetical protein